MNETKELRAAEGCAPTSGSGVLFLDVDGVLNRCGKSNQGLETDKCDLLADLCRRTGCQVVVSSTWRWMPHQYERLLAMFASRGIPHIGKTACLSAPTGATRPDGVAILRRVPRHVEITDWLSRHPEVTRYAIVDDDSDADDGTGRYVRTGSFDGLTERHAAELERLLHPRNH
jgi:hypothetical protein